MTPKERIAKLEALLLRVRARTAERLFKVSPRRAPHQGFSEEDVEATLEMEVSPVPRPHPPPPPPPPRPPRPAPPRPSPPARPVFQVGPGDIAPLAPPMAAIPPPPPPPEKVPEVEPIIDLARRKVPADEGARRMRLQEAVIEELTLDEPVAFVVPPEPRATQPRSTVSSSPPPDMSDVDDLMLDEPAPSSSRRPVGPPPEDTADASDKLAQMAFGDESSPAIHTPPPESGRLPAAPSTGLVEFDADITGVREAPKTTPPGPEETLELLPEVTRAPRTFLAAAAPVADVLGEAQRFRPATFGELLDATLAL